MSEEEIQAWKTGYAEKGLPSAMLDEMIAEANAEWDSVIGYGEIKRLAQLTITIVDNDVNTECFYRINVNWGATVFNGIGTNKLNYLFPEVPCVTVHIEIFKITNDGTALKAYGYALFNHSKDETATITLETICNPNLNMVKLGLTVIEFT